MLCEAAGKGMHCTCSRKYLILACSSCAALLGCAMQSQQFGRFPFDFSASKSLTEHQSPARARLVEKALLILRSLRVGWQELVLQQKLFGSWLLQSRRRMVFASSLSGS